MSSLPRSTTLGLLPVLAAILVGLPIFAADKNVSRPDPAPTRLSRSSQVPSVFARGETLTYTALLNELPAGESQIRLRKEQQGEREVYHARVQGWTSELIAYLYRLRGTADGRFTANGFTPLSFRLSYHDNDRPREIGVRYDPATRTLLGTTKKHAQAKARSVPAAEVYDPLTAFYLLRSSDLLANSLVQIEVFTGKERYRMVAHVIGKENVLLLSGIRPAIRLQPALFSLDDAPEENLLPQETLLWVTADSSHVPLKLESFLPIGRLVIELTS